MVNTQSIKNKLQHLGKVLIVLISVVVGAGGHSLYLKIKQPVIVEVPRFKQTHSMENTSVAINERKELLILNRDNGELLLLQDSVGLAIFNLYAAIIYREQTK